MKYAQLELSRNGAVKLLERDGETVIYQGKAKKAPIVDAEVIAVNKVGPITEIILAYGKTKEERAEASERSRKAMKELQMKIGLAYAMLKGIEQ